MVPVVVVEGVGAVVLAIPPAAFVPYQFNVPPVAVKADAVVPWQYVTGLVIVGGVGRAFTVSVRLELAWHPLASV